MTDGIHIVQTEIQIEFMGRPTRLAEEPPSDTASYGSLPLPVILGVSGSVALVLLILICALVFAAIRIRKTQRNLDQLTEADIREFREGTSFMSSGSDSLNIRRDSISANAPILAKPYNNEFEIPRDQLKIDESTTLGSGVFGTVLKGYIILGIAPYVQKLPVAVKTVKRNAGVLYFKSLLTELKIMAYIGKHPNIVCLIGACTQNIRKRKLYVAVELCSNGSFCTYLRDRRDFFDNLVDADGKISFRRTSIQSLQNGTIRHNTTFHNMSTVDLLRWSFQIANGMEFIASKKVIHGDIAARNILLDDNRVAKIADFGLSRRLIDYSQYNNSYTKKTQCPLPWKYMAPESLKDLQFSLKTDVWTFGVLLWEIFTLGQKPFSMQKWDEKFVSKLESGLRLNAPKFAPKEMQELMKDCWAGNPNKRPNFFKIKRHISELLHTKGDYTELNNAEDITGYGYGNRRVSYSSDGLPSYYGIIRRQQSYERISVIPPPEIIERPDESRWH